MRPTPTAQSLPDSSGHCSSGPRIPTSSQRFEPSPIRGALSRTLAAAIVVLSVVALPAEAKRLGGGGSFGRPTQSPSGATGAQRSATPPAPASPTAPAGSPGAPTNAAAPVPAGQPGGLNRPGAPAPVAAPASPWKRMLGAAAVGLGIAALASWMGVSSELAGILGIALVGLLILTLVTAFLRRRQLAQMPSAHFDRSRAEPNLAGHPGQSWLGGTTSQRDLAMPAGFTTPAATLGSSAGPSPIQPSSSVSQQWPSGFDAPAFISQAREQFSRLQVAFDHSDLNTLREVASTEVFEELRRQIDDRHGASNVTEVVQLESDLLEVQTDVDEYTASIRFHGLVREAPGSEPVHFDEVWQLAKPRDGSSGWLLVGIQNQG